MPFFHQKVPIFSLKMPFFHQKKNQKKIMGCSTNFWRARRGDSENEQKNIFFLHLQWNVKKTQNLPLRFFSPKKAIFTEIAIFALKMQFLHWKCHFYTENDHFCTENAIFTLKMTIFALEMPFLHWKWPFLHWKCHFYTELAPRRVPSPRGVAPWPTQSGPLAHAEWPSTRPDHDPWAGGLLAPPLASW